MQSITQKRWESMQSITQNTENRRTAITQHKEWQMRITHLLTFMKLIQKSSSFWASIWLRQTEAQVSAIMSFLKQFMIWPSSMQPRIFSSCNFIIRMMSEWMTFSPSRKNRSRMILEKPTGVLYSMIVMQYWENIVRSHSKSTIFWQTAGTWLIIRFSRILSLSVRPSRFYVKMLCQSFQTITPMNTQNTLSSNSFSTIVNSSSSSSFYRASRVSRDPAIRFIPCVYIFPLKLQQAIRMLRSSSRYLVVDLLRGTSLSICTIVYFITPSPCASSLQLLFVSFFIAGVLANNYHTPLRTENFIPLKMEKQTFFLGTRDKLPSAIIFAHSSSVTSRAAQSLFTKMKSLMQMFSSSSCSSSGNTKSSQYSLLFSRSEDLLRMAGSLSSKISIMMSSKDQLLLDRLYGLWAGLDEGWTYEGSSRKQLLNFLKQFMPECFI